MSQTVTQTTGEFLPRDVLDRRSKRLAGYSYKLLGDQFGYDVPLPEQMDIDENAMSVWIPFADGNRRDGVGDLLEVGGIRTERHQANPIVLFDHGKKVDLPIALTEDRETKAYTVQIDPVNQIAKGNAYFYQGTGMPGEDKEKEREHALFCEQLFDMIAKRYVRAGSIGYQVIKALNLQPDYDNGTPQGLHLLSVLMLELSAVVLPANGDTVRKMLCQGSCCGKPLSPVLVKSLSAYAPEKKAQMGYEAKTLKYELSKDREGWWVAFGGKVVKGPYSDQSAAQQERQKLERDWPRGPQQKSVEVTLQSVCNGSKIPPVRWKPGLGAVKDIKELRKKYRPTKALRRRLKKSSAGSSMVRVRSKDLGKMRELAEGKGLEFLHSGSHAKGVEKVRLSGHDGAIDEVAKEFGLPMRTGNKSMAIKTKGYGEGYELAWRIPGKGGWKRKEFKSEEERAKFIDKVIEKEGNDVEFQSRDPEKSMNNKQKKAAGKSLQLKNKALDNGVEEGTVMAEEELPPTATEDGPEEEEASQEPFGAQVLRRIHEDHSILMEEYDEMMGPLEHEEVKSHLQKQLEKLEETLTETEELFAKSYEELPQLAEHEAVEEEEEKDLEEEGEEETEEADSAPEEEPPPEEAVEGMAKEKKEKRLPVKASKAVRGRYGKKSMCAECGKEPCSCNKALKNGKAKDLDAEGEMDKADDFEEVQETKSLEPHEQEAVQDAHGFLGELGQEQNFGDEHRMKSYAHAKSLSTIHRKFLDIGSGNEVNLDMGGEEGKSLKNDRVKGVQGVTKPGWYLVIEGRVQEGPFQTRQDAKTEFLSFDFESKRKMSVVQLDENGEVTYGSLKSLGKKRKSMDKMDEEQLSQETPEEQVGTPEKSMGWHKGLTDAVGEAAGFLGGLARERAFGEEHRQKAMACQKALDPIAKMDNEEEVEHPESNEVEDVPPPGEIGEKAIKNLKKTFAEQNKAIADLAKKMSSLAKV